MNDRLIENQLKFINLRFGTFIHFNSATFQFNSTEMSDWEYNVENNGEKRRFPFDEFDWDPDRLDTDEWARVASSAGCRFAALTAKHHEGFALWNTKYGSHSIAHAKNKTDIVAKYLESFRKAGIAAGIYFSVLDLTRGVSRRSFDGTKKEYVLGQLRELLTDYGELPFIIIDGWNAPWGGPSYKELPFSEVDALVKSIQPDCLLMNIGCPDDISGSDILFYENAAGQEADDSFNGPGVSCNKLTPAWFWRSDDNKRLTADAKWAVNKAEGYFKHNTNFMLNISPDIHGGIEENLKAEFSAIGKLIAFPKDLSDIPEGFILRE